MKKVLLHVLALVCLVSCSGFTKVTVPQSTINIVGKDIETARFVDYTLVKSYILGIGGMSERARNTNIIDELMKKANLQDNEVLAYISVSQNISNFLIFTDVKYTASGYVVRPKGEEYNYAEEPGTKIETGGQEVDNTRDVRLIENEQERLYKTYERRIKHTITGYDLIKIKEDIERDVAGGKIAKSQAIDLYEKIGKLLDE